VRTVGHTTLWHWKPLAGRQGKGATAEERTLIASILREKPSLKYPGVTDYYWLIVLRGMGTREGESKVAWANARDGEGQMMSVAADSAEAFQHKVEGGHAQGNGNNGPGATTLRIHLRTQTLTIVICSARAALYSPLAH
jgi:hypothetical protein